MEYRSQPFPSFFIFLLKKIIFGATTQKGGQEWARRLEMKELGRIAAEEAKEREGVKKDQ